MTKPEIKPIVAYQLYTDEWGLSQVYLFAADGTFVASVTAADKTPVEQFEEFVRVHFPGAKRIP